MPDVKKHIVMSETDRLRKKKFLSATIITCIALGMIGGSLHIVRLGSVRMGEMRGLATYNLKEESTRIRAAGEDIALHEENENRKNASAGYTVAEADALLPKEQWQQLDSMALIPEGKFTMGTDYKN